MASNTLLRNALAAYLNPLLKKHEADQIIAYEDLSASWKAADAVLKQQQTEDVSDVIVKRLADLHKSQVKAYQETAKQALQDWAKSEFALPDITDEQQQQDYVNECIKLALLSKPHWRVGNAVTQRFVLNVVEARARAAFVATEQALAEEEEEENEEMEDEEEGHDEDISDDEEEQEDDDGEIIDAEDGTPENSNEDEETKKEIKQPAVAKKKSLKKKGKAKKKGTQAKVGGPRRKGPGGRARRGGRGGGANVAK